MTITTVKPNIRLGYYRHFKGTVYKVFGLVRDSETLEWLVLYGINQPEWVRTINNFTHCVHVNGINWERFKYLGEEKS